MKVKTPAYALAAMLAIPGLALAQSMSTTPSGTSKSPATHPTTATPVTPATQSPAPSTATYTTADQMERASKIIGATVYNDQNESVGSVNELLISDHNDISGVVLSVGGFLGINAKLVKVPPNEIRVTGNKLVMSGATKDQLKQMPDYKIVPATAS